MNVEPLPEYVEAFQPTGGTLIPTEAVAVQTGDVVILCTTDPLPEFDARRLEQRLQTELDALGLKVVLVVGAYVSVGTILRSRRG